MTGLAEDLACAKTAGLEGYRHLWTPPVGGEARSLLLFHGTGGGAAEFDRLGAHLSDGAAKGAARLSLQGDVSEFGAARFFRRRAEGVYDREDLAARVAKLDGFLSAAERAYGYDPQGAIGIGYSNGANILASLVFAVPGRIKRVALLHPLIPFEPPAAALSGTRVLIAAGRRDPIAPTAATQRLADRFEDRGASVELCWSDGGHALSAAALEATRRFIAA